MSKQGAQQGGGAVAAAADKPARRRIAIGDYLPAIIFVAILLIGTGAFLFNQAQSKARRAIASRANQEHGLPGDYPSELVPLYAGASVKEASKDTTESREGEPMDRWSIKATSPDEPKKIYEFYNELLLEKGLAQQMYISIPGGYGVDFADQYQVINFIIERDHADEKLTNIEITFNRLQSYKP